MARGFLSGVLWGGLVGVGVSSAASVLAPPPQAPDFAAVAPDAASEPQAALATDSGTSSSLTDAALSTAPQAPQVADVTMEDPALPQSDTTGSAAPQVTALASVLDQPLAPEEEAGVAIEGETPVLTNPVSLAPVTPQVADEISVDTQPAALPIPEIVAQVVPEAVAEEGSEAPQDAQGQPAAEAPVETAQVTSEETVPNAEDIATEATARPQVTEEIAEVKPADPEPETRPVEDVAVAEPQSAEDPIDTADATAETEATSTETTEAPREVAEVTPVDPPAQVAQTQQEDATPQADEQVAALSEGASARPSIGQSVLSLTELANGVTIRRPSSASLGQVDDGDAPEVASDAGAETEADPRPISRYGQAFERPADKPLMAIVLIDDGSSPVAGTAGISALRGFPYPLSFAVDTSLPDAAERMNIYRGEGFEVLAMVDLPQGAQATDVETTFGAILPQMSEVVGVLEGTNGGLQGSREVSDQVTSILQQTGHGLLAQGKGLNTMPKLARKEGVPAEPVFRDFDSKGQTAAVIRRFLDQAAFKAGQEGAVVMLGRLRPDTISALLLWGLQDRAGKVALSPISTVLLREE